MNLLPRTLAGRVALIVCAGLGLAHALSLAIMLRERGELGLSMMEAYLGRDVAASVAILDHLAPVDRAAWLPRLARPNYRYVLGPASATLPTLEARYRGLAAPLSGSVTAELGRLRVGELQQAATPVAGQVDLLLPLTLADGSPLTLHLSPPRLTISPSSLGLLALQFLGLALAAWAAVRLTVRPLARLSSAARALTAGRPGPPLLEDGPREVAQAAQAFNAMQTRIGEQLTERMQLLAAISHDLQTPITRMRLRSEAIIDEHLRARLLADLSDMQALVEQGLMYARTAQAALEVARSIDLHALLDGLVCDAVEAGHRVELLGRYPAPLCTRVQALRRLLGNLIDNAIKFGGRAQVQVSSTAAQLCIAVSDRGPGIAPAELVAVLQPFYRIDSSRSRDTGGSGLGLAIALQLSLSLGGRLELLNRAEGGLEARLTLPLSI